MIYEGATYYFMKNLQGDVVGVFNSSGTLLGEYVYDAWGRLLNSVTNDVLKANPFRYRGYYYDSETALYYLNSRYYDPEAGRFLNMDGLSYLEPMAFNGLNLYAYCGNNPVMYSDLTGCSPLPWWGQLLIGIGVIAVLAIATVVTAGIAGVGIGAAFAAGFSGAAIGIGVSGLAVTIASSAFAGAVIAAGMGFVGGAISGGLSSRTWSGLFEDAANGFMWGSIVGALSGGFRGGITYARTTPLIRSASSNELSSLKSSGIFSSNGSMESKWFATNRTNAVSWAKWFKQSDYVGIRVPKSFARSSSVYFEAMLDSIGPAYCIDVGYLNTIIKGMWFF